ncbi:MAG: adenylate/guanylate cyclase domain-containing protein [Limibacillus sp.]|jgi:class 3 adenylate cyclase
MDLEEKIRLSQRISTLVLAILFCIAVLVLGGLAVTAYRLVQIQENLGDLRNEALPRLIKLSQLSQDAAATIAIAPALSSQPTRFEFETLLSRIKDKQASQEALIADLAPLLTDEAAAQVIKRNGQALSGNLTSLTDVVSHQIDIRKSLEEDVEFLRATAKSLNAGSGSDRSSLLLKSLAANVALLNALLDPNAARFSQNWRSAKAEMEAVQRSLEAAVEATAPSIDKDEDPARELVSFWAEQEARMLEDKRNELSNEFKIKALAEENSLIANRLVISASNEFSRASGKLEAQIETVAFITRITLIVMVLVAVAFGAGNYSVWLALQHRVFRRLNQIRDSLQRFAQDRSPSDADQRPDEIGGISRSLIHYMDVIAEREAELAQKTKVLEGLSNQLSKYLSPQVYSSIFSGKQEVRLTSKRKKLTIFFSDIVGFTQMADRLESEELSQLLNQYLTAMSQIALAYGATIDKYVGDAILAFFGDPESRGIKEDAVACVTMAIAMRKKMDTLADDWREAGIDKPLQVRIGITTGYCTVGNFGSEDRLDYTIIGGAVNTASRLQSLAPPNEIIVSYETYALVRDEICCVEHGEVDVKGIAYPVATYKVLDTLEAIERQTHHFLETHPHMTVDFDLNRMNSDELDRAQKTLEDALRVLTSWKADQTGD